MKGVFSQPIFRSSYCSNGNYSQTSAYKPNLHSALYSILTNISQNDNGFYSVSAGQNPDKVDVIALCRGDVTAHTCSTCLDGLVIELPDVCPTQKEGAGWYDECLLWYSNTSILGAVDNNHFFVMWNVQNDTDPHHFSTYVGPLLNKLVTEAASGNSLRKFATGEVNVTSFVQVYALVQCIPDLSQQNCNICLREQISKINTYCLKSEGCRIIGIKCNMRFESYIFYNLSNSSLPPSPTPGINGNTSKRWPESSQIVPNSRNRKVPKSLIVAFPAVGVICTLVLLGSCFCKRIRKASRKSNDEMKRFANSLQYDFSTLRSATCNFAEENKLGEGGFGGVYKGKLENGQEIAVKRLSKNSGQGIAEFETEIVLVAGLQHKNLVKLLGYCATPKDSLLVYEFLPNSSLDRLLFDPTKSRSLDWQTRFRIIVGIARGLQYLHEDSRIKVVHRDLKSSNILLDEGMNPKIADFGLARLFGVDQTQGDTKRIVGTIGYMAPEYALTGHYSIKSDVYSFGVLVLEIISGQRNREYGNFQVEEALLHRAWRLWIEGAALGLVDTELGNNFRKEEVLQCIHIGLLCIQEDAVYRPRVSLIVAALSGEAISLPSPTQPRIFGHRCTSDDRTVYTGTDMITVVHPRD